MAASAASTSGASRSLEINKASGTDVAVQFTPGWHMQTLPCACGAAWNVNGQQDLPGDGHEFCPVAAMSSAR